MKKIFGIAVIAMSFMASSVYAGNLYVTGQYVSTKTSAVGESVRTNGMGLGVGYNVNPLIATEVTVDYLGEKYDVTGYSVAGWVVVDPTITNISGMPLKLIGRLGYAYTRFNDGSDTESDTGLAYGVGASLALNKKMDVYVDYRVRDVEILGVDVDVDSINLGLKYTY